MTVNWPVDQGMGNLVCDGNRACNTLYFPYPDPSTPYNLTCNDPYECAGTAIHCPANAECSINCLGERACNNVCCIYLYDAVNQ